MLDSQIFYFWSSAAQISKNFYDQSFINDVVKGKPLALKRALDYETLIRNTLGKSGHLTLHCIQAHVNTIENTQVFVLTTSQVFCSFRHENHKQITQTLIIVSPFFPLASSQWEEAVAVGETTEW